MGIVLFTSAKELNRAENIKSVYDAYDGEKCFVKRNPYIPLKDLHSGRYDLLVTDELLNDSPGKCIFIGHGMGAGKTYGLDQPNPYFKNPDAITYAIASSEDMIPIVAKQCGIAEKKVIPLGMPRTDEYFKAEKVETEKRQCLYAPTFREWGNWIPDWEKVSDNLPTDTILMVKAHMMTKRLMPYDRYFMNIVEYDVDEPTTPYLIKSDVVITDYSSIMFDAFVMRKPVVLFAKDKDRYLATRGMYESYPDYYSNNFCDTETKLAEHIEKAKWDDYSERLRQYYASSCDGHSVERVIELIRSVL